jgi:3-hydroxybutyryl-CoA dehydrogenase
VRVTIVGAGLMGAQIGCEYALAGHDVTLVARDAAAVVPRLDQAFALLAEHGLAAAGPIEEARRRTSVGSFPAGVECDLAVESVPEQLELKAQLLRQVAAASPDAILASNTSSIPITTLGQAVGADERVIGTHYLNPPLLMPPVEVVPGARTRADVVEAVTGVLDAIGKLAVVVRRDVPGFVWNRLQFALLRECAWLVDNGVAAVEDVDRIVCEGLARRWRRVGPFAAIGLGGLATWNQAAENLVAELATGSELGDLGRFATTDPAELNRLRAARDDALAAELRDERAS